VAEIGYAFSDTPWRNVNFDTPESGFAGLLDVFSITDTTGNGSPMVAGKVNLNTKQVFPLKGVVYQAYKDAQVTTTGTISSGDAQTIASNGVIAVAKASPLINLSDLVGRWKGGGTGGTIDGMTAYDGPAATMGFIMRSDPNAQFIERYQEAPFRALANVGSTRVWSLMIDLVAQTGRYPAGAKNLDSFVVEGEQRYWLHIAIDRLTGEILDKSLEVVRE
jgi:hypothetical protein